MNVSVPTWGRSVCTIVGASLAGPSGALVGGMAGGLLGAILPGPGTFLGAVAGSLTAQVIQRAGSLAAERLAPAEKQRINHDLQTAFRDAFGAALHDLGGERCFPRAWQKPRDVPPALIYPLTPQADRLWREQNPLAGQICACFQALDRALAAQRLLPLDPPSDQPAADVRRYLDAETPQDLERAFFDQVVAPSLADFRSLLAERPDLTDHLRRHLLDRTLVHLGELLKERSRAWRAFNRLLLEGLRDQVQQVETGQAAILARLDALLERPDAPAAADWADGLADLVAAAGQVEKRLDEGLDAVLTRVVAQHQEVVTRLDALLAVSERIESKVDRVLRILDDGRYVIEGAPAVAIDAPPAPGEPPFKGLQSFAEADADLFFGREQLTASLVRRLRAALTPDEARAPLLIVVGASGSGKSSLVRAGLIPALRRGEPLADGSLPPADAAHWPVHVITPTARPLDALAANLARDAGATTAAALAHDLAGDPRALGRYVRQLLHTGDRPTARPSSASHLLLVVDQFEELFTACRDQAARQAFVDNLLAAAPPAIVVLTLRADFYAPCAQFPALRQALETSQVYIGPMSQDELRRAITEPARRAGWEFERGLVDLILRDVGDEPGALPLLSHALLETWRHRRGRVMTLESYAESGGVRGAIAKTAETVYGSLPPEQQAIARHIFLRLVEPGEGTPDTRRRAALSELGTDPATQAVLTTLADARLVTIGEQTAEVAHEALIREWPTLQRWLDESRAGLRLHRRLTAAAQEWARWQPTTAPAPAARPATPTDVTVISADTSREGLLYRGARLAEATEWAAAHAAELNPLEREFLAASQALAEREAAEREAQRQRELEAARRLAEAETQRAEEQAQAAKRLRRRAVALTGASLAAGALVVIAGLLAVLALGFGYQADQNARLALAERDRAEAQARVALSRQLAAQSLTRRSDRFDLALLLSLEAYRVADTVEARGSLLADLNANPHLVAFLRAHQEGVTGVAFSPDGRTLASGSYDRTIRLWDLSTAPVGQPVRVLTGHQRVVSSLAFSPDGRTLASGGWDGVVILWNVSTGQPIGQPFQGHTAEVSSVAFSPDGKTLASGSWDQTIILWDAATGQPIGQPLRGHTAEVSSVAFSPDGRALASGSWDKTIILWDVSAGRPSGAPLTGHAHEVNCVAFQPGGQTLASGDWGGAILLWNTAARTRSGQPLVGHTNSVSSLAFSPDGRTLASGSYDYTVRLWDVAQATSLGPPLKGHTDWVYGVAFGPDGRTLASGGDNTVILWNTAAGPRLGTALAGHAKSVWGLAFSPDGRWLVSGGADRVVRRWNLADTLTDQPSGEPLVGHTDTVLSVAVSPDGRTLASGGADRTVILWDAATGQPRGEPLVGHTDYVLGVAFSPDGRVLASASRDQTIILWDTATGRPIGQPLRGHEKGVCSVAFAPDGRTLASGGMDAIIILWDAATGQPRGEPLAGHSLAAYSLAFSPDGQTLASGSWDRTVILWDVSTGQPRGEPLVGHTDSVNSVAFSPDGRTLASGAWDKTVILWDAASGEMLGEPLVGHTDQVYCLAFSPDGRRLASAGADRSIILWDVSLESWQARACQIVRRNLTRAEWERYLPGQSPRQTCADWPLETPATPGP